MVEHPIVVAIIFGWPLVRIQFDGTFSNKMEIFDTMAEWLRRWTANPLGSARAGSNPVSIVLYVSIVIGMTGLT